MIWALTLKTFDSLDLRGGSVTKLGEMLRTVFLCIDLSGWQVLDKSHMFLNPIRIYGCV